MKVATKIEILLRGAYDIHIHCTPDVVPRAQDLLELAETAHRAGMAGIVVKDHTTSTVGRAYILNRIYPQGPRFFSSLALNPPVGGLNPLAVEAALREGGDVIYFPTYSAEHQIAVLGADAFAPAYPRPRENFVGITILDGNGALKPEVRTILSLIAQYDAVLATGHLSPRESLALLGAAQGAGVRRMIVNHASDSVPGMSIPQQAEAVACGAFIEHCLRVATAHIPLETIRDQIRGVGVHGAIISSDFGQVANGPIVAGFARYLDALRQLGFTDDEVRTTIAENPRKLLTQRSPR